LPPLSVESAIVPIDNDAFSKATGRLFVGGLSGIEGRLAARRLSLPERVARAAGIIQESNEPWVVWCGLNEEGRALAKMLPGSALVEGSMPLEEKIRQIGRFLDRSTDVLITKVKVAGFGLNLQHCSNVLFLGLSDSYEAYYQAIRRCWRYGQKNPVRVVVVMSDIEGVVLDNIQRKEKEHQTSIDSLAARVAHYGTFELNGGADSSPMPVCREVKTGIGWSLVSGDCIEEMRGMEEASIDFTVFSPPFLNLFSYTDDNRDLGNSTTEEQFRQAYEQVADGLFRITKPGRLVATHVAQVAAKLAHDGFIGLKDFRGLVIQVMQQAGFDYHGDITIDKNPQVQAIRTHAKALLFRQLQKDASWLRPGLADYLLVFRKPGESAVPIHPDIDNNDWIQWAHPVWYDIRESEVLNATEARTDKDEKHIAPLQLSVIERAIRLWSNPNDVIFSPFAGIGSEGYVALKQGRQFYGVEIKPEYFNVARKNLERALLEQTQQKFVL
jgi:DNA modification methylase